MWFATSDELFFPLVMAISLLLRTLLCIEWCRVIPLWFAIVVGGDDELLLPVAVTPS